MRKPELNSINNTKRCRNSKHKLSNFKILPLLVPPPLPLVEPTLAPLSIRSMV